MKIFFYFKQYKNMAKSYICIKPFDLIEQNLSQDQLDDVTKTILKKKQYSSIKRGDIINLDDDNSKNYGTLVWDGEKAIQLVYSNEYEYGIIPEEFVVDDNHFSLDYWYDELDRHNNVYHPCKKYRNEIVNSLKYSKNSHRYSGYFMYKGEKHKVYIAFKNGGISKDDVINYIKTLPFEYYDDLSSDIVLPKTKNVININEDNLVKEEFNDYININFDYIERGTILDINGKYYIWNGENIEDLDSNDMIPNNYIVTSTDFSPSYWKDVSDVYYLSNEFREEIINSLERGTKYTKEKMWYGFYTFDDKKILVIIPKKKVEPQWNKDEIISMLNDMNIPFKLVKDELDLKKKMPLTSILLWDK